MSEGPQKPDAPEAPLDGLCLLLVEDEAIVALDLQAGLEEAGAREVHLAMRLVEADRLAQSTAYDAAVLDMRLPDGTTHDLARRLTARGVPVVFHTGNADPASIAREFPGAFVVRKPSTADDLVEAIANGVQALHAAE